MRERVFLFGDFDARPEGLERALVRSGFALAEGDGVHAGPSPDLALLCVRDSGPELERALARFESTAWADVPVIVLLATPGREGISRALSLGAADAMSAPLDTTELSARLEARLRSRAEMQRAACAGTLSTELFLAIEDLATAQRPQEMLEKLVRHLGTALGAAHCACLNPSPDRRHARLVAVHEHPTLRDVAVDLFHYPEAVEAAVSGRTVHAPEVLRDGLFLAHLAQWPDSPEVHEIASAAAVPLLVHRTVRAVLVLRTRRGDPVLSQEQVRLIEQLVNATAALMEREERRAGDSRRQHLVGANDPLTGCANLDALDRRLREELERVRRYGSGLVFALLDIDALRELNQRLGADAGDRFLAELGQLLQRELRTPDFVARYGSDEFALLMPATGIEGARRVIGRIAECLAHQAFSGFPGSERPRLAAGLVAYPHPAISGVEELLAVAERALASGKSGGDGDRVGLAA